MGLVITVRVDIDEVHRALLERLPEGDEDDHEVWSRSAGQETVDQTAYDYGDDGAD